MMIPPRGSPRMHRRSFDELRDNGLRQLREAVTLLQGKATAEEVDGYRRFVLATATKAAAAHREDGQAVSPRFGCLDRLSSVMCPHAVGSDAGRQMPKFTGAVPIRDGGRRLRRTILPATGDELPELPEEEEQHGGDQRQRPLVERQLHGAEQRGAGRPSG